MNNTSKAFTMVFLAVLVFGYKGCKAKKLEAAPLIYLNTAKNLAVGAAAAYTGYQGIKEVNRRNQQNKSSNQHKTSTTTTTTRK